MLNNHVQCQRFYLQFAICFVTEPEAEKEVFSDDSEGSDEIINLSSLSDSEPEDESVPEEDLNNEVVEETQLGNDNLKVGKMSTIKEA